MSYIKRHLEDEMVRLSKKTKRHDDFELMMLLFEEYDGDIDKLENDINKGIIE